MKEDLKKLRDMNKDDANSQTNVVKSVEDEDDVFLATNDGVAKTKWMMDSAVSKHICRDRDMFDTLKIDGEFSHFKLGHLELRWQKNKGNLYYLNGQALKRNHDSKVKKKLKFSNLVKVLGDTSIGGRVCSLSNWVKDISLFP